MSASSDRIIELFCQAKAKAPGQERERFLGEACQGDRELREQVDSLLRADAEASDFLQNDQGGLTPTMAPEKPGDRIGRYKLLEKIGEGGMGAVWMAEQTEPVRRRVALKVIKQGMDSGQVLARFEAERQALALMDHPNIARIFDAGVTGTGVAANWRSPQSPQSAADTSPQPQGQSPIQPGRPYFVMELVKGIPLTRFCDEQRLSIRERLDLFIPICQAIQHAHQKGIIHRDIKPSNVLVALYDGKPVPKVIDFGVAKAIGQQLTERTLFTSFGAVVGTLEYMPPEQAEWNQLDVDTRSDVYSLGVLLYELLTGTTPLTRETLRHLAFHEVLRRIQEEEPPRPSTRLSDSKDRLTAISARRKLDPAHLMKLVRGDLDWIVMKALEKDRRRRYESASGLALDVQRHLANEAIVACPPSTAYRVQKFVRRNRILVAASALVAAALALGAVVSVWQWLEAVKARNGEKEQRLHAEQKADAEAKAKVEANQQWSRAEDALSHMVVQRAQELFEANEASSAVAYLADALRRQPTNRVAAEQLLSALTYRSFPLRLAEPIFSSRGDNVNSVMFTPDSRRVVTTFHPFKAQPQPPPTVQIWDALTGRPLSEAFTHEPGVPVQSIKFSPDGEHLLTTATNSIRLWDARTGRQLTEPLHHGTNEPLLAHLFSPDGERLLTASSNSVLLWDIRSGQPRPQVLTHETNSIIVSAVFTPDAQRLFTLTGESARLWNARTGQPLTAPVRPTAHESEAPGALDRPEFVKHERVLTNGMQVFESAQFSADGKFVVAPFGIGSAYVWDGHTAQRVIGPLRHETNAPVNSVQISSDGSRVLTVFGDKTIRLWETRSGTPWFFEVASSPSSNGQWSASAVRLRQLKKEGSLTALAPSTLLTFEHAQFSPDGQRVLTVFADRTVRLWNTRSGGAVGRPFKLDNWPQNVRLPKFSRDGKRVLLVSDNSAFVWNAATGEPASNPVSRVIRHRYLADADFSADGARILTRAEDSARVWDVRTGEPLTELMKAEGYFSSAQFSPDGQRVGIVLMAAQNVLHIWEVGPRQALPMQRKEEKSGHDTYFSPDGERALSLSRDQVGWTWRIWDASFAEALTKSFNFETNAPIMAARISTDHKRVFIITGGTNGWAYWTLDADSGRSLAEPLPLPVGPGHGPHALSLDGRWLLITVWKHPSMVAGIWDLHDNKSPAEVARFDCDGWVSLADISPDGKRVVTAAGGVVIGSPWGGCAARIWDARTGQPTTEPLRHDLGVRLVRFSPDGESLVTISGEGTVRIWNVHTGLAQTEILQPQGGVQSVEFAQGGRRLVTVSRDGKARLWDVRTGLLVTAPSLPRGIRPTEVPDVPIPVPAWLPELAEAVACRRLNSTRALEHAPDAGLWHIRRWLVHSPEEDFYTRWAKWFFADPSTRTSSPFSKILSQE